MNMNEQTLEEIKGISQRAARAEVRRVASAITALLVAGALAIAALRELELEPEGSAPNA